MCGIFCLTLEKGSHVSLDKVQNSLVGLLKLAQRRGREASGMAALLPSGCYVIKQPTSASELVRSEAFAKLMETVKSSVGSGDKPLADSIAFLGHARLVTNGKRALHANNQPFQTDRFVGVHNGIIVNADDIMLRLQPNAKPPELDSLSIAHLLSDHIARGSTREDANSATLDACDGIATYLLFDTHQPAALAGTNNGSLHSAVMPGVGRVLVSEHQMLKEFADMSGVLDLDPRSFEALEPGTTFSIKMTVGSDAEGPATSPRPKPVSDLSMVREPAEANLKRCSKCLLPETMPFIDFDKDDVCNWCRNNPIPELEPLASIEVQLEKIRKRARPNCLIAVSGGRDSCYGLHVAKKVLGLDPVAFTYDWGMVTDIARRNTSRLCAKLGIEHILVSADIDRKRENVRKNVEAWLKKPDLGTVPLFTAGDKQFYFHANRLKRELELDAIIFCENGRLEKTWFKAGFCGVNEGSRRLWNISLGEKMQLAAYYGRTFATNPAFLNASMFDTFSAYVSSYFLEHDYIQLFNYVDWREEEVERVLRDEYDWEFAPDAPTSWRIGDGTAPFYNYIYYTAAGFTEFDTFRSNQIRAGHIDRATAAERIKIENQPRFGAIKEYTDLIGVNFDKAIRTIQAMPRLY